jgi:hypothetical protein
MTVRADHVAGAFFIGFGLLVFALSGDLPMGRLSMPGAGFLPTLTAGLMILLGIALVVRARESAPLAAIGWSDISHAIPVVIVTATAIALYAWLGFVPTMLLMLIALLVLIERRNILRATLYSAAVVMVAFGLFGTILTAPLLTGPFGF